PLPERPRAHRRRPRRDGVDATGVASGRAADGARARAPSPLRVARPRLRPRAALHARAAALDRGACEPRRRAPVLLPRPRDPRLAGARAGPAPRGVGPPPRRASGALLAVGRRIERRARLPFGLSLIVHARKPV